MADALLDTSVYIAREVGRPVKTDQLPRGSTVSVVTLGELRLGLYAAVDDENRARRLQTLAFASMIEPLPVDDGVAASWGLLRRQLRHRGLKMEANDSWIAATAIYHRMPVLTQDNGFPDGIPHLEVIRV